MKWNESDKKEVRKLWTNGLPLEQIAERIGRSFHSVRGFINRSDFPDRTHHNKGGVLRKQKSVVQIEEPPRMIAKPEGALFLPWIDLDKNQCQWHMSDDFFEPASNHYLCCGLPVIKHRCCEYHLKYRKKDWEE